VVVVATINADGLLLGLVAAATTAVAPGMENAPIAAAAGGMEVVVGMNGEEEEEVKGPVMTPLVPAADDGMFDDDDDVDVDENSPPVKGPDDVFPNRPVEGNLLTPGIALALPVDGAPKVELDDALNDAPMVEALDCFRVKGFWRVLMMMLLLLLLLLLLLDAVMGEDPINPPNRDVPAVLGVLDMKGLPMTWVITFDATTMLLPCCCSASSPSSRPLDAAAAVDAADDDDDDDDDVSSVAVETGAVAVASSLPLPAGRVNPVEEEETVDDDDDVVETAVTSTADEWMDIGMDSSAWIAMLSVGMTSSDDDICMFSSE